MGWPADGDGPPEPLAVCDLGRLATWHESRRLTGAFNVNGSAAQFSTAVQAVHCRNVYSLYCIVISVTVRNTLGGSKQLEAEWIARCLNPYPLCDIDVSEVLLSSQESMTLLPNCCACHTRVDILPFHGNASRLRSKHGAAAAPTLWFLISIMACMTDTQESFCKQQMTDAKHSHVPIELILASQLPSQPPARLATQPTPSHTASQPCRRPTRPASQPAGLCRCWTLSSPRSVQRSGHAGCVQDVLRPCQKEYTVKVRVRL